MTLREIYTYLESLAQDIPDIRTTLENDVLKLNTMRGVEYGVFAVTQNTHTSSPGWMRFNLNLFYIDRLTNSGDNEVQVQSHAIEVLQNLLRKAEELQVDEVRYTTFTNRFQDLCAGAWAEVVLETPESECAEL